MPYIAQPHKRYKFSSKAKMIKGEKPNFLGMVKEVIGPSFRVLDLGCGSGELALRLAPLCRRVDGIDSFSAYIRTAQSDKRKTQVKNVYFKVASAEDLPYPDGTFDLVYSSRGPLSANLRCLKESVRVLKPGGWLAEETIGEKDKRELKKIFGRGQNWPVRQTKLQSVKSLLIRSQSRLISSRYYLYYQLFPSGLEIKRLLLRAPIIPEFDVEKDARHLETIRNKADRHGLILSAHRLLWMARKR